MQKTSVNLHPAKFNTRIRLLILTAFGLLLVLAGIGIYFHIYKVRSLNNAIQLEKAKQIYPAPIALTDKDDSVFTYNSRVSPLKIKLPKEKVVIVNIDGNKGGAPGMTLRIGSFVGNNPNIISDNVYSWIRIDTASPLGGLEGAADFSKKKMEESSYGSFEGLTVGDRTVVGLPAKQIEGKGLSYAGTRRTVVFVRGEY